MTNRSVAAVVAGFAVYVIASIVLFDRAGMLAGTRYLGNGTDPFLYIWAFYFIPHAILHGQNPFIIPYAWAPAGLNITQATTTPTLALLAWPLTALVGPVVSFNIVSLASPALSAAAAFALAFGMTRRVLASLVAGWIFGFSTFEFGALLGHLQTDFVPLIPLMFLAVVLRGQRRLGPVAFVAALSMLSVLEFGISLESFVTTALFLGIFVVARAIMVAVDGHWRAAMNDCTLFALSFVVTAFVVSPYAYYFFSDYAQIPRVLMDGANFSIDLMNFIVPTNITWLGHDLFQSIAQHFMPDNSEELGYIGLPLVVFTAIAIVRTWRDRLTQPLIILLLSACLFALGPVLTIEGQPHGALPWMTIQHLPLMANVITGRLMVYAVLGIGAVCALWLSRFGRGYYWACAGVFAAALLTLPNSLGGLETGWSNIVPNPLLFRTNAYRHVIAPGEIVMVLPFKGANGESLLWQTMTHGYFRVLDGYGDFIQPPFTNWPATTMLSRDVPGPDFGEQFNLFMKHFGARMVLIRPAEQAVWGKTLVQAGWHATASGRTTLYTMDTQSWAAIPSASEAEAVYAVARQHLVALKRAAACMVGKGAPVLNPDAAIAANCLDPAFSSLPGPVTNWDRMSDWLGFLGEQPGISVITNGATAQKLVSSVGVGANKIYFPYPKIYDAAKADAIVSGQLILTYRRNALKPN